jgi:hypothetical protein
MKRKLINLFEQTQSQSRDWFDRAQNKLSTYVQKSDYQVYRAKALPNYQKTFVRVGNSIAIIGAFMGVAVMVNEPLRAELVKSIAPNQVEFASNGSSVSDTSDMEPNPVMQPVSMGPALKDLNKPSDLLTPEILQAPVPSIEPLARQIPGKIDPSATLETSLMSSLTDQQKVANFMANKYGLDPKAINRYVSHAVVVAKEVSLDPVLLVAVMSIESNFNPNAQSGMGAQGLMQVLTRVHVQKYAPYGGPAAAFKPEANIRVGAYILKYYIAQAGSLAGGLRYYVGGAVVGDGGYAAKVMRERDQLNALLRNTDMQVPLSVSSVQFNKVLPAPVQAPVPVKQEKQNVVPEVPQPTELVEVKEQES